MRQEELKIIQAAAYQLAAHGDTELSEQLLDICRGQNKHVAAIYKRIDGVTTRARL